MPYERIFWLTILCACGAPGARQGIDYAPTVASIATLASLCLTAVTFFSTIFIFLHLFNDRLEPRDLRTCQTDLHQIFRVGRHVAGDVRSGILFRDRSRGVAMATNFKR